MYQRSFFKYKFLLVHLIFTIFFISCTIKSNFIKMYAYDLNRSFSGVVKGKYIDSTDHMSRNLIFKGSRISILNDVYEKINIGDSILKKRGDSIIYIYKKNGIILKFNYNDHHKQINPYGYKEYISP